MRVPDIAVKITDRRTRIDRAHFIKEMLEGRYADAELVNVAEIELSVLKRQCLAGRIPCIQKMRAEVDAWNTDRNNRQVDVDWQFRIDDARVKLKRLYPKL